MRILLPIFVTGLAALSAVIWARPEPAEPTPEPAVVIAEPTPVSPNAQAFLLPAVKPVYAPTPQLEQVDLDLDANSAVLYFPNTGATLFSKNENVRAPIASLTKILTAMVVDTLMAPHDIVTVSSVSVAVDGGKQTLFIDEEIRVADLVTMMLVESSNDAAYALAEHGRVRGIDLVGEMNHRARELGMSNSHFTDPSGLDDAAFSTVGDLVKLVRATQKTPELWGVMRERVATVQSVDGTIEHHLENTNQLIETIPGVVWGKTGNTDGALGCMILVVKLPERDDTLVSVVLGSRARFTDTERLFGWASDSWDWN